MSPEGLSDCPVVFRKGSLDGAPTGDAAPGLSRHLSPGTLFDHPTLPPFALQLGNQLFDSFARVEGHDHEPTPGNEFTEIFVYVTPALPGLKIVVKVKPGPRPDSTLRHFFCQTMDDFPAKNEEAKLRQWKLVVSGLGVGPWQDSVVSVPMARMRSRHPMSQILQRPRTFSSDTLPGEYEDLGVAPDCGLGAVLLSVEESHHHLALIPLAHESPVRTFVFGHEDKMAVEHLFQKELFLAPGQTHLLGSQVVLAYTGERPDFLREVSRIYAQSYPVPPSRPTWAGTATVLEADFIHYGGISGLTEKLPELKDQGFDTIYLMPWHTGPYSGYGTWDYWEIDPAKGSFEDLQNLTRRAHELELRVLFDLLVNMVTEKSRYLSENPDWFYRDAEGHPQRHAMWPGFALDPASPGFRKFLSDYCLRCVRELGADGFRVDAVSYRGGNWHPLPGRQPYEHAHAIFTLLGEIRTELQAVKPDAILMAECFGPAQVPVSDLVCYQWVGWLDWVLQNLVEGSLTGQELGQLLEDHFGCMPRGTWLTTYTHTHDTVAFQGREWEGPAVTLFLALLHLASAGVMTFGGGWNMRARPSVTELDVQRRLAALKKITGTVASHELWWHPHDNPDLIVLERPSLVGKLRISANFSALLHPWQPEGSQVFTSHASNLPSHLLQPWELRVENLS